MTERRDLAEWHYDFHHAPLLARKLEGRIDVMPQPHRHPEVELSLLVKGSVSLRHDGVPVEALGPQLNLFWAMREHQIVRPSEDVTGYLLIISLSDFHALNIPAAVRDAVLNGAFLQVSALTPADTELSRLLFDRWNCDLRDDCRMGPGMAAELAALLTRPAHGRGWTELRNHKWSGGKSDVSLHQALAFIIANSSQALSLAIVARAVGQHPETLARRFRESLGSSMDTIINDVRIARARRRLDESTEKVATIAMECGFGSLSHFAEQFGKRSGMSPTRYRRRH